MAMRMNVEAIYAELYLPETTFAKSALPINDTIAAVDHILSATQCSPRKTQMLRGLTTVDGNIVTNKKVVDGELVHGHFRDFGLFAGNLGFGMELAAGSHDKPMWWTEVSSISFQSPVVPEDEVVAIATITKDDEFSRVLNGKTVRDNAIHTRASGIRLEPVLPGEIEGPHLPQHAWLEVAAHFGGGALAALGKFPGEGLYPIYLGVGKSSLAKELALPGDQLRGIVTVNSVEELELPDLGKLTLVSVDEIITREVRGSKGRWQFQEVEFGFMPKDQLMEAIARR